MCPVEAQIASEPSHGTVAVRVRLRLTQRELSRLFVDGDVLIQLPTGGSQPDEAAAPIQRSSIFVSELARERDGYVRRFSDRAAAQAFAASVGEQLDAVERHLSGPDDA